MDKNDIEIIRLLVRDKGGVMERRSWKSICKTLEARPTANNKHSMPRCENCGGKLVTTCVNKKCDWSPVT